MTIRFRKVMTPVKVNILELSGGITNEGGSYHLKQQLHELIYGTRMGLPHGTARHRNILLRFDEVPDMDSTGTGDLVLMSEAVRKAGGILRICGLNARILNKLRGGRIDTVLNIGVTEAESMKFFCTEDEEN